VTHEYVIATGGQDLTGGSADGPTPTAIAWAADRVLAVGSDADVRAISRGDSTFLDLDGCLVTAAPVDIAGAEATAARSSEHLPQLLVDAGLLPADDRLEPGSAADLMFWGHDRGVVAVVRRGAFTTGDEHTGPFARVEP
jgi:hypothetical protein